jgi:hypothetical protein
MLEKKSKSQQKPHKKLILHPRKLRKITTKTCVFWNLLKSSKVIWDCTKWNYILFTKYFKPYWHLTWLEIKIQTTKLICFKPWNKYWKSTYEYSVGKKNSNKYEVTFFHVFLFGNGLNKFQFKKIQVTTYDLLNLKLSFLNQIKLIIVLKICINTKHMYVC